jgi:hypothetical protein
MKLSTKLYLLIIFNRSLCNSEAGTAICVVNSLLVLNTAFFKLLTAPFNFGFVFYVPV